MGRPAYQKAGHRIWVAIIFIVVVLLVEGAILAMLSATGWDKNGYVWILLVIFVPGLMFVSAAFWLSNRLKRERIAGMAELLRSDGFRVVEKPGKAERVAFLEPLAHLAPALRLTSGAAGVQWFAVETVHPGKPAALVFEHKYQKGTGSTTHFVGHTVVAWPAGHPDLAGQPWATSPWFLMAQFSRYLRRGTQHEELKASELAGWQSTWSMFGDVSTGVAFLFPPTVRTVLDHSPLGETWSLGANWVCLSFSGLLKREGLSGFLTHGRAVLKAHHALTSGETKGSNRGRSASR